ncbi:MAG: hypothetical protein ABMB14_39725 [Myxococcota bacterium]
MSEKVLLTVASDVHADDLRVELSVEGRVVMDLSHGTLTIFVHPDWVQVQVDVLIEALLQAKKLDERPMR